VNETPENTSRTALKTLTLLDASSGISKSRWTAVAESPASPNLAMIV